ncbi:MAG: hypothetical protein V6Z81_02110 [Parvularculales bacterium]
MSEEDLQQCLPKDITPADWYRTLNRKVFFWLTEERLFRLTSARAYRNRKHDVLEICTHSLIEAHRSKIWLCPINSGFAKFHNRRDHNTFSRICCYPYGEMKKKDQAGKPWVVELTVDYSVPDIAQHVVSVKEIQGKTTISTIK